MKRICLDCRKEVVGKLRRERCRPCYDQHVAQLKADGAFVPKSARHPGQRALAMTTPGPQGCVVFAGSLDDHGYGEIASSRERGWRPIKAYRAAYELLVGAVPDGMDLDHLCHTRDRSCPGGDECLHRRCINPYHLEPVTRAENLRRGRNPSAINARKTHCKRGHEFTPENTYLVADLRADGLPRRKCRTCRREQRRVVKAAV